MVCCCNRGVLVVLLLLSLLSAPVQPSPSSSSPHLPPSQPSSPALSSPDSTSTPSSSSSSSSVSSSLIVVVNPLSSSLPSSSENGGESLLSSVERATSVTGGRSETRAPLPASSSESSSPTSSASSSSSSSSPAKSTSPPASSASSASSSQTSLSSSSRTASSSSSSSSSSASSAASAPSSDRPFERRPEGQEGEDKKRGGRDGSGSAERRRGGRKQENKKPVSAHDRQVLKAVESSLLGALGLRSRPRGRVGVEVKVPPYMWDLYHAQFAAGAGAGEASSSFSSSTAIRSPFLEAYGSSGVPANTVRSFYHTEHHVTEGCDPSTCARLLFDVTSVPDSETLAAAELRIFVDLRRNHSDLEPSQSQPKVRDSDSQRSRSSRERRPQDMVVEVHEIMQTRKGGEEGAEGDEKCIIRLLDTRRVKAGHDGSSWESFDIHPAVLKWKRGRGFNKGLEIRLVTPRPSDARHVRVRRSAEVNEERWRLERPLLVTYTDDGRGRNLGASSSPSKPRSRRAAHSDRKRERRRKGRAGKVSKRNNRRNRKKKRKKRKRTRKGDKNQCRRHALYVDFQEVGWEDWIVAPDGYNAYFCQGDCNFPLAQHLNSTNHAIVQTLVNSVDPTAVSKACCVPTELSAISMLYLNERGKVQLKNYQDMVVEACGCR